MIAMLVISWMQQKSERGRERKMDKLKSIDLFAGIGGIRLGFDRAFGENITTVFVSEWDENVQKTYKANFKIILK